MVDAEIREVAPRRDPTLTILFSLFLTVFAFFILLNAIAVPQRGRERSVAKSVSTAFSRPDGPVVPVGAGAGAGPSAAPVPAETTGPSPQPAMKAEADEPSIRGGSEPARAASGSAAPQPAESADDDDGPTPLGAGSGTSDRQTGAALRGAGLAGTGPLDGAGLTRAVGRLFDPGLPVLKNVTADRGRLMQVTLPATDLFDADGPDVRRSAIKLIDRIAVLIARRPTGVRYTVTFTAAISPATTTALSADRPPEEARLEQALAIRRGIALIDVWNRRGGPPDALSIGVRAGRRGEVRLTFDAAQSVPELTGPGR